MKLSSLKLGKLIWQKSDVTHFILDWNLLKLMACITLGFLNYRLASFIKYYFLLTFVFTFCTILVVAFVCSNLIIEAPTCTEAPRTDIETNTKKTTTHTPTPKSKRYT